MSYIVRANIKKVLELAYFNWKSKGIGFSYLPFPCQYFGKKSIILKGFFFTALCSPFKQVILITTHTQKNHPPTIHPSSQSTHPQKGVFTGITDVLHFDQLLGAARSRKLV